MAVSMIGPKFYAWDRDGNPLAFGKLYTYQARTNTPKDTYQSEDQVVTNSNPVILNGEGYADVYLSGSYKMVLKDSDDNEIWSSDPVSSSAATEWNFCMSPAYVSSTIFKLSGNYLNEYTGGRRVRVDNNTSKYSYSTIISSSYAAGETTVTISNPVITTGVTETCVSIIGEESQLRSGDTIVISEPTIQDLIESFSLLDGDTIDVKERTAGNSGGAFWDAVPLSSVTPDGRGILACINIPSLAVAQRIDRTMIFETTEDMVAAAPMAINTPMRVLGGNIDYIASLSGEIDLGSGLFAKKVTINQALMRFNRNALAVGTGESSSVGASWDYANLDGIGFISSNVSKNHGWLSQADSFQYLDFETPFGVIIGDSIAEGHGSPDRHGRLDTGTVPIYDLSLPNVAGQPSYHLCQKTNMHWYNHGIGGQTTTQVLARFRRDALGETVAVGDGRPDTTLNRAPYSIWVNAGINDISLEEDIEVTKQNLIDMCSLAKNAGIVIGFNTCGPHNLHDATKISKQKNLRDFMFSELPVRGAYVFDFRTWFENPSVPDAINPDLGADNVHPSGAGYLSYVSELIKQTAAPIVMQQLCFESKADPDAVPSSFIDSNIVTLMHVADEKREVASFSNQEALCSCNFDMTNTKELRATMVGVNYPINGSDWIGLSRIYGVFGNQKLPDLNPKEAHALLKHTDASGFEVETTSPINDVIDVTIISTTHLRVRFTRFVKNVRVSNQGTSYPYDVTVGVPSAEDREAIVYIVDKSTGSAIDPNTASGTFFFSVTAE